MKVDKKVKFECCKCHCNELAYKKYVECITHVKLQESGDTEYGMSKYDEDDYLCADNGYICMNCEAFVEHCGCRFEIEKDLLDYLTMDPAVRTLEQQEYEESLKALVDEQKDRESLADEIMNAEELF